MHALRSASMVAASLALVSVVQARTIDIQPPEALHASLMAAVALGEADVVGQLLDRGASVDTQTPVGLTPLMRATMMGHLDVVELLVERGADLDRQTRGGWTALLFAADSGQLQILEHLLDNGAGVRLGNREGLTPFARLFERSPRSRLVETMLELGADPNTRTSRGDTPLTWAAKEGDDELASELLEHGADPNVPDANGSTPLIVAIRYARANVVRVLLEQGVDPSSSRPAALFAAGETPWLPPCQRGRLQRRDPVTDSSTCRDQQSAGAQKRIVSLLLEHGADLTATNDDGQNALMQAAEPVAAEALIAAGLSIDSRTERNQTPLMIAATKGNESMVELFLRHGIDANAQDDDGYTALQWAALHGHIETVQLLLEGGADANIQDNVGNTPLTDTVFASCGAPHMVDLLVKYGAKVDLPNARAETALMEAARKGCYRVAARLLAAGADVEARNGRGQTPLFSAAASGRRELVELLLEHGADLNAKDRKGNTAARQVCRTYPDLCKKGLKKKAR